MRYTTFFFFFYFFLRHIRRTSFKTLKRDRAYRIPGNNNGNVRWLPNAKSLYIIYKASADVAQAHIAEH